jgi:hypothetical protein
MRVNQILWSSLVKVQQVLITQNFGSIRWEGATNAYASNFMVYKLVIATMLITQIFG